MASSAPAFPRSGLTGLRAALDAHRSAGRVARFWWRDDDAVEPSAPLDHLLEAAAAHGAPLGLAVIPARVTPALADRLTGVAGVSVLQHGWSHADHAALGAKKRELGDERPLAIVTDELAAGHRRLTDLFGSRFVPALVPPWNRVAATVAAALPAQGFTGLSTHAAQRFDVAGLAEANTHIDPVDWRGGGGVATVEAALHPALTRLSLDLDAPDRPGTPPTGTPIGLLTHHLVMDDATWALTAAVAALITEHPAAVWVDPNELFAGGAA